MNAWMARSRPFRSPQPGHHDSGSWHYDFPADHWQHLRTTNPIESTFATVRHRTTRTKNCVPRSTFLGLAFKLVQEVEKPSRRIRGAAHIAELMDSVVFKDGEPVVHDEEQEQQKLAA